MNNLDIINCLGAAIWHMAYQHNMGCFTGSRVGDHITDFNISEGHRVTSGSIGPPAGRHFIAPGIKSTVPDIGNIITGIILGSLHQSAAVDSRPLGGVVVGGASCPRGGAI